MNFLRRLASCWLAADCPPPLAAEMAAIYLSTEQHHSQKDVVAPGSNPRALHCSERLGRSVVPQRQDKSLRSHDRTSEFTFVALRPWQDLGEPVGKGVAA
eukprot:scpid105686/ scgid7762/ 